MAKRKKVDAVILLGDVFEKIDPPGRCRNAMVSLFMAAKESFPLYVVIGNHDIKSSMANYASSTLGTLIESDVLIYTDYEPSLGIRFLHLHKRPDSNAVGRCGNLRGCILSPQVGHTPNSKEYNSLIVRLRSI